MAVAAYASESQCVPAWFTHNWPADVLQTCVVIKIKQRLCKPPEMEQVPVSW